MRKMTDKRRIEIGREFVALHKNSNIDEWLVNGKTEDERYLDVYHNLDGHVFGCLEVVEKFDDTEEYQITISSTDSRSGDPILFSWEVLE